MNAMLPLILVCCLLCGCGRTQPPEETAPPVEAVVTEVTTPEEYGGAVQEMPLNLKKVRGLRVFGGDLLLFSGQGSTRLTLLDRDSLEETASLTLDFQLEEESVRFHPEAILSFFDPSREETVVLDGSLTEVRRIPAPGAITGPPILSGNTLYYCTASHLRAWDLDTGIHRCIKEMAFGNQVLSDVLMDGTVLQCTVTEEGTESTLFLSSRDGRQLHTGKGFYQIITRDEHYYARLPAGHNQLLVYGSAGSEPQLLTPMDPEAKSFFLPDTDALLTAAYLEDDRVQISCYDLSDGTLWGNLILDPFRYPSAADATENGLYLLTYDPSEDQNLLLRWELPQSGTGVRHSSPYSDRDLSQLRREAQRLGDRYGIRILIGDEAAAVEPPDYSFEEESLPSLLHRELEGLDANLSRYPEEVIRRTAGHFDSLTLCIVRSIAGPEKCSGVQFLQGSDARIVIAAGKDSEQALYHQFFHLMEICILSRSKALDRWNELNPAGFQYDYDYAANAVRDSGVYLFEDHRAFVDTYSMSFPKEDRARIMEYAMQPGNADLFRTEVMQHKLNAICTGIRDAYDLEDRKETFPWEQYLE